MSLLLLLLALTGATDGPAEVLLSEGVPDARPVIVTVAAHPAAGFHHPYVLYLPAEVHGATARLLVETANSGISSDDPLVHEDAARWVLTQGHAADLADRVGSPMLIAAFARPSSQWLVYTHALDRDTLLATGDLERLDLQLCAMIRHARGWLAEEEGIATYAKVFLHGFSASGCFANRFTALQPGMVQAAVTGGLSGLPIYPVADIEGHALPFPIGVADLDALTGAPFDREGYGKVAQLIYMGAHDRSDALPFDDMWSSEERELIGRVAHERMYPERWSRSRAILEALELPVQLVTYEATGHEFREEVWRDIVAFYHANQGASFVPIEPHAFAAEPFPGIETAHINGVWWKGDPRIPEAHRELGPNSAFTISIEEWLPDQDHRQLDDVLENHGFAFVLRAPGHPDVTLGLEDWAGTRCAGDGSFQALDAVDDRLEDTVRPGITYTVHPVARPGKFRFVVREGVSLVRR